MGKKWKRNKEKEKKINIAAIESGIRNYMRNHPILGEQYRREESLKELFGPKDRKFR